MEDVMVVIGAIIILAFSGLMLVLYVKEIFNLKDNKKIYFSPMEFLIANGLTLASIVACWMVLAEIDYRTFGSRIDDAYCWGNVIIVCLIVSTMICLLPNFYNLYKYYVNGSKILLPYVVMSLGISCLIYFLINIGLNNYIGESVLLIFIAVGVLIFILIYFISYNANRIQILNKKCLKKINNINKQINKVISKIEVLRSENLTKRKYNKARRKINKSLSAKNIYRTFQPVFNEDESVLKVIKLMDSVSEAKLEHSYNNHKMLFYKENAFRLLGKVKTNDSMDSCDVYLKNFSELLKGTIENNNLEIKNIVSSEKNDVLYKKYHLAFKESSVMKKLILFDMLIFIIVICLVTGNIALKLNQERIVAANYGKNMPGYELIDKSEILGGYFRDEYHMASITDGRLDIITTYDKELDHYRKIEIFESSNHYYKGDKLRDWNGMLSIDSIEAGRQQPFHDMGKRTGIIGFKKDGSIIVTNEEKKWFDISRYDLYVGLYYNESKGKYFGLKANGGLVQLNKQ